MRENILKPTAMFLLVLVIMIPVYSSFVFAELSNGNLEGIDKVKGYYRSDDVVIINVTASIEGDDDIIPSQVKLGGEDFQSCALNEGTTEFFCSYSVTLEAVNTNHRFDVKLYFDDNRLNSVMYIYGSLDDVGPEIEEFEITTPFVKADGEVILTYRLKDKSKSDMVKKCTGIKFVKADYKAEPVKEYNSLPYSSKIGNEVHFYNDCVQEDTVTVPVSEITDSDGEVEVALTAYDNFENPSAEVMDTFIYDSTAPVPSGLEIIDKNGVILTSFGNSVISGSVVSFTVTDANLTEDSVYADLSGINVDAPAGYDNKQASCTKISNEEHRCTVSGVQVKLNEGDTAQIGVSASDLAGNSIEKAQVSAPLTYDGDGPVVNSITTNFPGEDGKYYVGSLTNFTAELTEPAGVDKEDIKLDLRNINRALNDEPADDCTCAAGACVCNWYDIRSDALDGEKIITLKGKDRLGNVISAEPVTVTVDRTNPSVIPAGIEITARGGGGDSPIPGYTKTGDNLDIKVTLRDSSEVSAYADFSNFVYGDVSNVAGTCSPTEEEGVYACEWTSPAIDKPGYINKKIILTFVDAVGNKAIYQPFVEVQNYLDTRNPEYWTHTVTCSPKVVDRQITTLTEYRIMCSVELEPRGADQETISIGLGSCQDNIGGSTGYIVKPAGLVNAGRGSTNPYLSITLLQQPMPIDEISVNCPLSIISRVGNDIMQFPEVENITVNIGFYNMPLGEFSDNVIKEVKSIRDDTIVGDEYIGTLNEVLFWADKGCGLAGIISSVAIVVGGLEKVLGWIPAIKGLSVAIDGARAAVSEAMSPYCAWISCKKTLWWGWYEELKKTAPEEDDLFGRDVEKFDKFTLWPETPRDSIVLSAATGCLPGIIEGLERWRQVQCNYGVCVLDIAENDIPLSVCDEQRSFLECKYVRGEFLKVLPLNFLREPMKMFAEIISDPLGALSGFVLFVCPVIGEHAICTTVYGITNLASALESLMLLGEKQSWKIQGDMCEVYFEKLDKLE